MNTLIGVEQMRRLGGTTCQGRKSSYKMNNESDTVRCSNKAEAPCVRSLRVSHDCSPIALSLRCFRYFPWLRGFLAENSSVGRSDFVSKRVRI